ncbi:hypothetical protein H0H92_011950, partial [Tricholoma furcatifolium]
MASNPSNRAYVLISSKTAPKKKNTARKFTGGPAPKINLHADIRMEDLSTAVVPPQPKSLAPDNASNNYCTICLNGGQLVVCSCGRVVCQEKCLYQYTDLTGLGAFTCPFCWSKERNFEKYLPFQNSTESVMILTSVNTRSPFPMIWSESTAILSFYLKGFCPAAATMAYYNLIDYFDLSGSFPSLAIFNFEFDFSTPQGIKQHEQAVKKMIPTIQ